MCAPRRAPASRTLRWLADAPARSGARAGRLRSLAMGLWSATWLAPAAAAQTLEGVLLERDTDRPVALGLVTLFTVAGDSVSSVLTDDQGRFRLASSTPGEFLLAASALGYESTVASSVFELSVGGSMSVQFRIRTLALQLEGITVEADASVFSQPKLVQNGFVERAQSGFGRHITPMEIESSYASGTAELLERTGRVTTRYGLRGQQILMRGTGGYCTPIVYLDDVRVSLRDISIEAIAPLQVLEAAEVYRSASEAPLRYGGGMQGCGVILLWTKGR